MDVQDSDMLIAHGRRAQERMSTPEGNNSEEQKSESVIAVAQYSDPSRSAKGRGGRSADALRLTSNHLDRQPSLSVLLLTVLPSADLSLRSADASQRSIDRECIENLNRTPINILLDCLQSFVKRCQPYEFNVTRLLAEYLCTRVDTMVTASTIDTRIEKSVGELKNFLFSADSTRGRAAPAINFSSWSSRVYSQF